MIFQIQKSHPFNLKVLGKFVFLALLFVNVTARSQGYQKQIPASDLVLAVNVERGYPASRVEDKKDNPAIGSGFKEAASLHNIPIRKFSGIKNWHNGYYVVAGVFSNEGNADTFLSTLKDSGLDPGSVLHPVSNLHYIYLGSYGQGHDAIDAVISGMQGRYKEKLWIMNVQESRHTMQQAGIKADTIGTTGPSKGTMAFNYPLNTPEKYLPINMLNGTNDGVGIVENLFGVRIPKDPPSNDKLLEKADSYFNKMWYAQAAQLYELVLKQSEEPSFELIMKAGDSHYFNTDMERAYYWYDLLFSSYKDEMSAEYLFKYAHALKGTGKYARAKRITRLYKKESQTEETDESEIMAMADSREALLDNILSTEEQIAIRNLSINSRYSDFAPMFHNENEVVFASAMDSAFITTRRYKWNNQPFLDLYVGKLNEESGEVRDAVKFSKKVNTRYHEAGVTFSPDNSTMYFTRNNYGKKLKRDKNGVNNLKIYQSSKMNGEWSEAVELPFNSDEYSTGHPALSPDGKQLYFVSDMPGTIGGTDIFVVDIREDGSFSEPRNLGPEINTEGKEMFPFINASKLYFASDGHVGLGGLDIYEVAYNGTDGFLEVRNLGKPINSNKDDFSFIVKEVSQKGFFASNRMGGKGDDDIYSFERLAVEKTNENSIAGVATERLSGNKIPDALIQLLDENNRKLKEIVGSQDGSFVFEDLEGTTRYVLRVAKDGYKPQEQIVTTLANRKVQVELALERLEDRVLVEDGIKKLKTDMIYFDFDKSAIRADAAEELDKLVSVMQDYPEMIIKIESHTDSRGGADYNKYLSGLRAQASRDYLIQQGIAPDRIESAKGYGEERLLNECNGKVRCNSVKHERNRRSEFIIVSM